MLHLLQLTLILVFICRLSLSRLETNQGQSLAILLLLIVGCSVTQTSGDTDSSLPSLPSRSRHVPPTSSVSEDHRVDPPQHETSPSSSSSSSSEPKVSFNPDVMDSSPTTPKTELRKANYTEPRFATLFNSKARRPRLPPVRHTTRAKPTLPPFIKSPPSVKVTTEEPPSTRPARTAKTTTKATSRTTTSAPRRGRTRDSSNQVSTESPRKNRRFGDTVSMGRNSTRIRGRN